MFAITGLLIWAVWLVRVAITGSNLFGFIMWNMFLATVPLLIEPIFRYVRSEFSGVIAKISKALLAVIWLLFLPNAFYILTDFMHLNSSVVVNQRDFGSTYTMLYSRGDGQYIFDSLFLFAATAFGAYAGGLALYHAYKFLVLRLRLWKASLIICTIMLLSAIGVYLGRFGRWNSWQGLTHPLGILNDLTNDVRDTSTRGQFFLVVFTLFIFSAASLAFVAYTQRHKLSGAVAKQSQSKHSKHA